MNNFAKNECQKFCNIFLENDKKTDYASAS